MVLTKRYLSSKWKAFAIFYLFIHILTCCEAKRGGTTEVPDQDDILLWLNRYSVEKSGNTMSERIQCYNIEDEHRDAYIEILNENKYVILSEGDYHSLTGQALTKRYALAIRGIGSHPGGFFRVYKNFKNELNIIFRAEDAISFYKKAVLVIEVDELPDDIYNGIPFLHLTP